MANAEFFIGQIIQHNLFGYRGVIYGIDPEFNHSDSWYENVALSRPPKDKPWYHVLVDQSMLTTYVAERNLTETNETHQIEHPLLGQFFHRYDTKRYFGKQKVN